jgi:FkbM family methyltransferase
MPSPIPPDMTPPISTPLTPDLDTYLAYLYTINPELDLTVVEQISEIFEHTQWRAPTTPLDCNNWAVMALVQAECCATQEEQQTLLDQAWQVLSQGGDDPLCIAHRKLLSELVGNGGNLWSPALLSLAKTVQALVPPPSSPILGQILGLVYLPKPDAISPAILAALLAAPSVQHQAVLLLSVVLTRANLFFYNSVGLRSLQIQAQLLPSLPPLLLKLGIAHWLNSRAEGLVYLHQAWQQAPTDPAIAHAWYLLQRALGNESLAQHWHHQGQALHRETPDDPRLAWTQLPPQAPFSYLPFEDSLTLAVEPTLNSIVTSVLLTAGDWFEKEMEFWRSHLAPGMVVIDVGANAGVYTFSAAQRVGPQGRVIAVEPFSDCVQCLQETRRLNQLEQVTICHAAASDRVGTIKLGLGRTSELNAIQTDDAATSLEPGQFEEVPSITLDHLAATEGLTRLDAIKIDAETHEIPVLQGSEQVLQQFRPIILYENSGPNVAEFLRARGYAIYWYQPYLNRLVLSADGDGRGEVQLNLIALPLPPTELATPAPRSGQT